MPQIARQAVGHLLAPAAEACRLVLRVRIELAIVALIDLFSAVVEIAGAETP